MSKRAEDEANKAFPGAMVTVCARGNKFQSGPILRHGFIRGYDQAEKDLGWHSVDESLPKMDEEVIVLKDKQNTGLVYEIAFGHLVDTERCIDYNGWNVPDVKFWMPMPKIPEEKI